MSKTVFRRLSLAAFQEGTASLALEQQLNL
jgi:hypothetical protein